MKRKLDASVEASEPHDFAVRVQHRSSAVLPASIASRPASVTIANRPFGGTRRRGFEVIWVRPRTKLFSLLGLDRPNQIDALEQIPFWARRAIHSIRRNIRLPEHRYLANR